MNVKLFTIFVLSTFVTTYAQTNKPSLSTEKLNYVVNLNKHNYFFGATLSLNQKETQNKNALIFNIDDETQKAISFGVDGGYAVKDNFFVGIGIEYGQNSKYGNYTESDLQKLTKKFSNKIIFRPFIKNYVPISSSRRFNLITQTELSFSLNQSITQSHVDNDITRTLSSSMQIGLGIRPGLSFFVINNFAIETTVNVVGLKYIYERSETTGITPTYVKQGVVDLKIDLLQLNLGFFVYF